MLLKRSFIFFFLFFFFGFAYAQKPIPRIQFAKELIGKTTNFSVIDIETDSTGAVYFAGSGGLGRSNGNSLNFDWKKKDPDGINVYLQIHKDFGGELWLSSPLGISHLKGDSIIEIPISDSLAKLGSKGYESIYRDRSGILHVAPRSYGHYTISPNGEINNIIGRESKINGFIISRLSDGKIFHQSIASETENKMSIYYLDNNDELVKITDFKDNRFFYESSIIELEDGSLYLSKGSNEIIHFKNEKHIKTYEFPHKILNLFLDKNFDLWISTTTSGFFKAKNTELTDFEHYWRGNAAVMTETPDGNLWLKAVDGSFGYIAETKTPHYSYQNGYPELDDIALLNKNGGKILVLNTNNRLYDFSEDSLIYITPPGIRYTEGMNQVDTLVRSFCYDSTTSKIWVAYNHEIQGWDGKNWVKIKLDKDAFKSTDIKYLVPQKNGRLIGTTKRELFEIINDSLVIISEPHSAQSDLQHFETDYSSGKIWVSAYDGLWILENKKFIRPFENMPKELTKHASSLFYYNDAIWFQPLVGSLYRIKNDTAQTLPDQFGNLLKIFHFSISLDNELWVTTNKVGNLIQVQDKGDYIQCDEYQFSDIPRLNSRPNTFIVKNKSIYWGSTQGLFVEKTDELRTMRKNPIVNFTKISINNKGVTVKNDYKLAHNENYFQIEYEGVNFRRFPFIFSTKMEGVDSSWTETIHTNVQYTNLDPGKYVFNVRTQVKGDPWSEPTSISFTIAKPYWETWWFITLCILTLIFLVYLIIVLRIGQVRNREKNKAAIKVELARLELKALRAQINPHFIFNSITSVLSYLSKNNNEKAEEYLQRFARLIRQVLENSDKQYVSLKEELELMKEYIILESEHYDGEKIKFTTKFNIAGIEKLKIPPTLLQPYIENAVRHGLKTKDGSREIIIKIGETNSAIEVIIEDNGIGRAAAAKSNLRSNHKSMGILISSQRIELMNKNEVDVQINDLTNEEGKGVGTQVVFFIPYTLESTVA